MYRAFLYIPIDLPGGMRQVTTGAVHWAPLLQALSWFGTPGLERWRVL